MATQLFLNDPGSGDTPPASGLSSEADQPLWFDRSALTSGGTGRGASTVNGPTSGIQIGNTPVSWWTVQLSPVTISGTVTMNLWMDESNMSANVGAQVIIDRCDGAGAFISTILNSEKGTELPVTTPAAQNWTATPTSTTLTNGDRIRLRVYGNDVGTMATGFTFEILAGNGTAAGTGDSWIQFTETLVVATAAAQSLPAQSRTQRNFNLRRCVGRAWGKRPSGIFVPSYAGFSI